MDLEEEEEEEAKEEKVKVEEGAEAGRREIWVT